MPTPHGDENSRKTYRLIVGKLGPVRKRIFNILLANQNGYEDRCMCANQISQHYGRTSRLGNDNVRARCGELYAQNLVSVVKTGIDQHTHKPNNFYRALKEGETLPRKLPKKVTRKQLFDIIDFLRVGYIQLEQDNPSLGAAISKVIPDSKLDEIIGDRLFQ